MLAFDRLQNAQFNTENNGISYRGFTMAKLKTAGLTDAELLAVAQAWLRDDVDAQAEDLRLKVLTPGAGQALEYQEVQAQAAAALAAPAAASAALYPMLAATIGVDIDPTTTAAATDVLGVARSVMAATTGWIAAGAAIRGARLHGKAAIDAATTIEAAAAAADAIAWPALT